jgi:hypothetical protein
MQRRELLQVAAGAALLAGWRPGLGQAEAGQPLVTTVGTRTNYAALGLSDGSTRWMITRLSHTIPPGARDLQLVYGNFAPDRGNVEADGPNPIAISAELEFPEGNSVPVRFGGLPVIRLLPGEQAVSDPVDVNIPPGDRCFSRTQLVAEAAPYKWPLVRAASPQAGDWSVTGADPAVISDAAELRNRQFKCFGPYNVVGRPVNPGNAVVVVGDSVICGEPGPGDRFGNRGYVERALATAVPWCNLAVPGESAGGFVKQSAKRLRLSGHHFTHAISALGIAEVRSGNEELTKANLQQLWNLLANQGLAVFQTTITTHTTSTDRWTSVEGQAVANPSFAPGGIYHRINQWIRSTPPPLRGYFDPVPILETGVDSGIWRAPDHRPLTLDGPHPDALAAEMASTAISTSVLLR